MRGLKFPEFRTQSCWFTVALYTSAWIEIILSKAGYLLAYVALYTSAWIEILRSAEANVNVTVALYTSAWIEIGTRNRESYCRLCRTLHECVDWNIGYNKNHIGVLSCRTLHECVDWNNVMDISTLLSGGRTLHECVDWNRMPIAKWLFPAPSHSTRVRGLKFPRTHGSYQNSRSHSTRVRGLK